MAVDLDALRGRGHLFIHGRDGGRERRLGLGWEGGRTLAVTEYRTGRLSPAGHRDWLLEQVHGDYRGLLAALLRDERLRGQGGYWVQRRQGQDTEIYLTYPWHPPLASLAPSLEACLPAPLPGTWPRYRAAPVRHVGFSGQLDPAPALTLYASAPYTGPWPLSLGELEDRVMDRPTSADRSPNGQK